MANATSTIRAAEAHHFGALAADWWDPKGRSAMLHRLNPVRLGFIRAAIDGHFWRGTEDASHPAPADAQTPRGLNRSPLTNKAALDVGCGAGLLCEPLARLGAAVTGVDAAAENITAAKAHAAAMGLAIDYRQGDVAAPGFFGGLAGFDLVTALEVVEHVGDKPAFIAALANAVLPSGLVILSTPNRTLASRLMLVEGAERLGMVPKGTHHWSDFITPEELRGLLADAGLAMGAPQGIAWAPHKGLHLASDLSLNYIVTATRA